MKENIKLLRPWYLFLGLIAMTLFVHNWISATSMTKSTFKRSKILNWKINSFSAARSRIECASLIGTGAVASNAYHFDSNNNSSCLIGTVSAGNSWFADHGDLVYHEPSFTVLPHVACISAGSNSLQDLTIPLNQNDMSTLAVPPPSKLEEHACGMAYDGGLLYCSPYIGECMYHKLGTAGWTQPIEMQPGFVTKEPGCAIVGGKLWISGGSPTLDQIPGRKAHIFADGIWVQTPDIPIAVRLHAAVGVSEKEVMFCGGSVGFGMISNCWLYQHDTETFLEKASLRQRKWGHSLGLFFLSNGTKQLVSAGGNRLTSKLEIYSFELDTWTPYPPAAVGLTPSRFVGLITVHRSLYFISLYDLTSNSFKRDIYKFNADNRTLSTIGSIGNELAKNVLILFNM